MSYITSPKILRALKNKKVIVRQIPVSPDDETVTEELILGMSYLNIVRYYRGKIYHTEYKISIEDLESSDWEVIENSKIS